MVTEVFSQDRIVTDATSAAPLAQPANLAGFAADAWAQALHACASRLELESAQAVADQLSQGSTIARMLCCHGLAEQIAASLWSSHQDIQAVYTPDCDSCPQGFCLEEGVQNAPFVHLLVWAQHKTPALTARAAALGHALARICQDALHAPQLPPVLHVGVVDDEDLQRLFGAGQRTRWPIRLQAYFLSLDEPVERLALQR